MQRKIHMRTTYSASLLALLATLITTQLAPATIAVETGSEGISCAVRPLTKPERLKTFFLKKASELQKQLQMLSKESDENAEDDDELKTIDLSSFSSQYEPLLVQIKNNSNQPISLPKKAYLHGDQEQLETCRSIAHVYPDFTGKRKKLIGGGAACAALSPFLIFPGFGLMWMRDLAPWVGFLGLGAVMGGVIMMTLGSANLSVARRLKGLAKKLHRLKNMQPKITKDGINFGRIKHASTYIIQPGETFQEILIRRVKTENSEPKLTLKYTESTSTSQSINDADSEEDEEDED